MPQSEDFYRHIKANGGIFQYIYCHVIVPPAGAEDTGRPVLHMPQEADSCNPFTVLPRAVLQCLPPPPLLFPAEHCLQLCCRIFQSSERRHFILHKCYISDQHWIRD